MQQDIKQLCPANKIKQARFYKPCIYDKQLGFNKPAVVIADSLFVDFGICVLTVVCAICATSVQSRGSEQTHSKSPTLAHKQALIKNYCFYDQTTQNYSTANNQIKHYLHFTPSSRQKLEQAFLCQQTIIRLSYCNRLRLRKKTQSTIVQKNTVLSTS